MKRLVLPKEGSNNKRRLNEKLAHPICGETEPLIKVWNTTNCFGLRRFRTKKQMVHVKMYIIANTTVRGGEVVVSKQVTVRNRKVVVKIKQNNKCGICKS